MQPRAGAREMRRLLEVVARDVGDGNTDERAVEQRERFKSLVMEEDFAPRPRWLPGAVAAAALAVVGLAAALLWPADDGFGFYIGTASARGRVGTWLESPSGDHTVVQFEQGSRLTLMSASSARVLKSNRDEVVVELSQGSLAADVVGNRHTQWSVDAGPFRVSVLGTRFTVTWDTTEKVLDVDVRKGVVLVQGSGLREHGIKVTRGHRLRAESRTGAVSFGRAESVAPPSNEIKSPTADRASERHTADEAARRSGVARVETFPDSSTRHTPNAAHSPVVVPSPPLPSPRLRDEATPSSWKGGEQAKRVEAGNTHAVDSPAVGASTAEIPASSPAPFKRIEPIVAAESVPEAVSDDAVPAGVDTADPVEGDPSRSWRRYYEQEQYVRAVAAAESIGIDSLAVSLTATDLWKLQDAARIAKRADIATDVLAAYRNRFPDTKRARLASFLLGKVASDETGRLSLSVRWFNTYLREDPDGPLAEEALGRLIILYGKVGSHEKAEKAARQYLKAYPSGSFEGVAQSVVDGR